MRSISCIPWDKTSGLVGCRVNVARHACTLDLLGWKSICSCQFLPLGYNSARIQLFFRGSRGVVVGAGFELLGGFYCFGFWVYRFTAVAVQVLVPAFCNLLWVRFLRVVGGIPFRTL